MKKRKNQVLIGILLIVIGLGITVHAEDGKTASVTYHTHVQSYGWQEWKRDGVPSGTTGESKRLEAIEIRLDSSYSGGVEYRTHVQSYGWQGWKADGALSGTTGEAKRLEAIEIRLTGEVSEHYDIYYRTHLQSHGWMGWAKNGAPSGSSGYSKRLEAIEIQVVPKNGPVLDDGKEAYIAYAAPDGIQYSVHVQTYGWQAETENGEMAGTVGEAKRLEAIQISLQKNRGLSGSLLYRTHVQSFGWMDWVEEGRMSGTSGMAKRLEAIQIKLTGEMAEAYDVYYRVHAQSFGWLGWAKNGQPAGTAGQSKRLEAIEIVLKKKGEAAPGTTSGYYYFQNQKELMDTVNEIQGASQIITVVGDGTLTGADLNLWTKQDGRWIKQMETKAQLGVNGFSDHTREGDGTTPTGSYPLGVAFGNKKNPGTALDWFDVNPYHYWVDDLNSSYYNQLIDSRETPDGWSFGEHLADYVPSYNYSVNIEVNPQCRKDSTSAIFLHCFGINPYTQGCVAVKEEQMRTLLTVLKPGAQIILVKDRHDLMRYVEF